MMLEDGSLIEFDAQCKDASLAALQQLSMSGLRTLAVAFSESDLESPQLTLLGVFGVQDPLRIDSLESVAKCKEAGIKVRMVTGDALGTAVQIARQCGILTDGGKAISGHELSLMTDAELQVLLPTLQVVARCQPADKLRLVKQLQAAHQVVAVTGDGANDAPCLSAADVGLAMGCGSDLAKQASGIVLLNDSFTSVVTAILWGRSIYDNIRKFVQFQVTGSAVGLLLVFIGAVSRRGTPLRAVQLLWAHMVLIRWLGWL